MSARRRRGWSEPELDIGPTDLALVAETYPAPTERPERPDPADVRAMFTGLGWSVTDPADR